MVLEYQNEKTAWDAKYQYMFGDFLLVAPALEKTDTEVSVWLPKGNWVNFFSGKKFTGDRTIKVPAKLGEIPVFIKEGAIIPMGPEISYADEKPLSPVTLDIYPGDKPSSYSLYEDDGVSRNYLLKKAYALTTFSCRKQKDGILFNLAAPEVPNPQVFSPVSPRNYILKFNLIDAKPAAVEHDFIKIPQVHQRDDLKKVDAAWYYDAASKCVWIKIPDRGNESDVLIKTPGEK
jgi:hypothetical protein